MCVLVDAHSTAGLQEWRPGPQEGGGMAHGSVTRGDAGGAPLPVLGDARARTLGRGTAGPEQCLLRNQSTAGSSVDEEGTS